MTAAKGERAERRAIIENDRRVARERGFTYAGLAHAEANVPRGRYGTIGKEHVTGVSPDPVPRQSQNSWPNQAALVPAEPPLGFAIDALEPVGSDVEIEQSLRVARDGAGQELPLNASPSGDAEPPRGRKAPVRASRSRRRSSKKQSRGAP